MKQEMYVKWQAPIEERYNKTEEIKSYFSWSQFWSSFPSIHLCVHLTNGHSTNLTDTFIKSKKHRRFQSKPMVHLPFFWYLVMPHSFTSKFDVFSAESHAQPNVNLLSRYQRFDDSWQWMEYSILFWFCVLMRISLRVDSVVT